MSINMSYSAIDQINPTIKMMSSEAELSEMLTVGYKEKFINGAQWFRIADLWYRVNYGYNNPLNYGTVHSELMLINEQKSSLTEILSHKSLVMWGVGVGDTEMGLIDLQLRRSSFAETLLIDINKFFLKMFVNSLSNRKIENINYDIHYCAINCLFEKIQPTFFQQNNSMFDSKALICLGSTIGNFNDPAELFEIFNLVSAKNDIVLIGYQLNNHLDKIYSKYKNNPYFNDLIGNYLNEEKKSQISWRLNHEDSKIEAWLDDVQIFRSKKFTTNEIREKAMQSNLDEIHIAVDVHENFCVHAFIVR